MKAQPRRLLTALAIILLVAPGEALADGFEVWLVDQSNTNGLAYGGTLHIYDGEALLARDVSGARPVASIDLAALGGPSGLCFLATDPSGGGAGANPVRPHMLLFDADHTRAVLSFVASGHVAIFDAETRTPLACFRMQAGAGGVRQAHAAFPSPDGRSIVVANQNGKLLERIDADFTHDVYVHTAAATLDLASCVTPNGVACQLAGVRPDNAPICPIVDSSGALAFITLRGGGLFVVDPSATPMAIVAEYDAATVHGNGCGGVQARGSMFLDSGGATATNRSEFDVYRFPLKGYGPANPPNTPAPIVVFSDDYTSPTGECHGDPNCRDAHGMALSPRGRTLWVADRHRNVFEVFDVATNARANVVDVSFGGTVDSAPDLLDLAAGKFLVASLRGPNPLSGDPHVATGSTPGMMVLKLSDGGRDARITGVVRISNVDAGGVERADAHGIRVRVRR
jgi:DNA-binding beta-propeller fold protein YncE